MTDHRSYRGKVISHVIWRGNQKTNNISIKVSRVEMIPGLAGTYSWIAKPQSGAKALHHHGKFDTAIINGNQISFYVDRPLSVNGKRLNATNIPILVIEFEEGEVTRLLSEDRWFKKQSWFKVIIKDLQLSIF